MIEKFNKHTGVVVPLDISNVDTDAIIPKQFLQKISRAGFGAHLFHEWRFLDEEGVKANPDFILNHKEYKNASILLARENFGCGSSREHAPWALKDYGFRAIIAPSFADIFYGNCLNNQILPIRLSDDEVDEIFTYLKQNKGAKIHIDLEKQILVANEKTYHFEINEFQKHCLLEGLDSIGLTLKLEDKIKEYEKKIPNFLK